MWFVGRLDRLDTEIKGIDDLRKEGWISHVQWEVDVGSGAVRVAVDFDAGSDRRQVWLTYPPVFPSAPPKITPRNATEERWTSHQWLSGELCLQIRADNWRSSYTGADMIRSAWHLLSTEAKIDAGERVRVPSAHSVTEGQRLSWKSFRLIASAKFVSKLREQPTACKAMFELRTVKKTFALTASTLELATEEVWSDPSVPHGQGGAVEYKGLAAAIADVDPRAGMITAPSDHPASVLWSAFSAEKLEGTRVLCIQVGASLHGLLLDSKTDNVTQMGVPNVDDGHRIPARNAVLAEKRVAIVGCGSVGSKIASTLARSGTAHIVLIDDDVLHPGNLVRHELDWISVGSHKAKALQERLELVNPGVKVDIRLQQLGTQTSTGLLVDALNDIGACDLVIDASGSPTCFNYIASIAEQKQIPMVWGLVFAGGYGGFMARSRPGADPGPQAARERIDRWCSNPGFPSAPKAGAVDYAAQEDEQATQVADDADVSILAANMSRFAIDLLVNPSKSDYPHSAYMIGLREEWIFTEPFAVHPIPLGHPEKTVTTEPVLMEALHCAFPPKRHMPPVIQFKSRASA